jgi:hypothetical protein
MGNCIYAMAGLYGPLIVGFPNSTEAYCLGGDLEYEWDFDSSVDGDGDGNFTNDGDATVSTPTYTYYDDGVYTVTLTVTDASGLSDWDTCIITVLNVAPTPEWTSQSSDGTILNPPYPEGKEILFEATVYDPGIYDTFTYDWYFGDGMTILNGGPSVTHAYGDNDLHIVVRLMTHPRWRRPTRTQSHPSACLSASSLREPIPVSRWACSPTRVGWIRTPPYGSSATARLTTRI